MLSNGLIPLKKQGYCVCFNKGQRHSYSGNLFYLKHLKIHVHKQVMWEALSPRLRGLGGKGHRSEARKLLAKGRNIVPLHSWACSAPSSSGQGKKHPSMAATITAEPGLTPPGCSQPFSREFLWLETRPRGFWTLSATLRAQIRKAGMGVAGTQMKELFLSDWK